MKARLALGALAVLMLALPACRNPLSELVVAEPSRAEGGVGVVEGEVTRGGAGVRGVAVWLQSRGPRARAEVVLRLMGQLMGQLMGRPMGEDDLRSDAAGRFRIPNVPAGPYDLVIEWGAFELHQPGLEVAAGEVTHAHVTLGTGRIAVQVVDARGAPVPGVTLKAFPPADPGVVLFVNEVTDRSGRMGIELVGEGRWWVEAALGAGIRDRVQDLRVVEGATTQAVLRLSPYGVASIRVVDAARRPLAGRAMQMNHAGGTFHYANQTDARGIVAVPAAVGAWRVKVDGAPAERWIEVADGRRTDLEIVAAASER